MIFIIASLCLQLTRKPYMYVALKEDFRSKSTGSSALDDLAAFWRSNRVPSKLLLSWTLLRLGATGCVLVFWGCSWRLCPSRCPRILRGYFPDLGEGYVTPPPIIGSHYSILINLSVQSSGSVTEWGRKKLAKRKPLFPGEVPPLLDTQAQGQMFFLRAVSPRRKFQNTIPGSGD